MPTQQSLVTIEVKGLRELRKDLARLDKKYRKGLDKSLKAAAKPIADAAKKRYRVLHPRRRGGKGSQRAIRAVAGGGRVRVLLGSDRFPYLLGQEWGALPGNYPQFPPSTQSRPPDKRGYFFWPSVVEGIDQVHEDVQAALDKANRLHFDD